MLGGRQDGELRPSAGGLRYLVADGGEAWQGLHDRAAVILAGGGAGTELNTIEPLRASRIRRRMCR
jgi:hypothetical protein